MKETAIGYYLCISPDHHGGPEWYVEMFDKRGFWKASRVCESKAAALKQRRRLIALHLRLAIERCNRRLARIGRSFVSGMADPIPEAK